MSLTDPARELAATLELLGAEPNENLDERIARAANVQVWSSDFFRIIFEILARFELLENEIADLPLDEDIRSDAMRCLREMKSSFTNKNFLNTATNQVRNHITGANPTILKMLSPQIRERISYHLFTAEERQEVLEDVEELMDWLVGVQSEEKDFIREALISGLREFHFRLGRLEWFGSGYSIDALREVMHAYLAMQGADRTSGDGKELTEAILLKTKALVVKVLDIMDVAKDASEKADWALRVYGAISILSVGSTKIAGLLN